MMRTPRHFPPIVFRFSPANWAVRLALVSSILGGGAALTRAQSTAAPRSDNQIWSEVQLAVPLNKKVDFVLLGLVRLGRDMSRPVNERIGVGFSTKLGNHLTVFPFYQHIASQPTPTNHNTEERITLEVTARFPAGHFTISDRNRIEFHFHSPPPNFKQYRNRLQVQHPILNRKFELDAFVADEVFYDSIAAAWIRNRFAIGIGKKFSSHFSLELYYLRQNDSHSHPGDINAIGSTFKFRL